MPRKNQVARDISSEAVYDGDTAGVIIIHAGGRLTINGAHRGGVIVYSGGQLVIRGRLTGGLHIFEGGHCLVDVGGFHDGQLSNDGQYSIG